ncbi:MAG: hypothetical protein ACJAVX_002188 [Pseudoalteromonas rhizosphaerae]|jgi:hypothetical protein|uniref:SapC family protein n=1 Tax=Pseudoalteromonas neustonica TaxID=1840331 RepID=A0ABY3FAP0_9GAMM|nr:MULTISPECIES: SapC family protein [Pseudoalteromonas]MBB1506812.1 SapC family protein [Pseudoalteromonas sp. SG41-1]TVU81088.1 SapC family protein [Pseudoalteromonas neustonica]|tara:strand:+ start:17026 stop:17724 length:699 start_codon:yes stop_codon:yes gene_type:complete
MSDKFEVFNVEKHKGQYVKVDANFSHIKDQHVVPITPIEIAKVALNFPVCFMKSSDENPFKMVAILGLESGRNVFYNDGHFKAMYVPQHVKKHPFTLAKTPEGQVFLAVETAALNTEKNGEALFDNVGEPSDYLIYKQVELKELARQEELSTQFTSRLVELGLLTECSFKFDLGDGQKKQISGLYSVDRDLLKSLDDESLLSLQKQGMLEAIYSHLVSLGQFQRVIDLSANT